eukprot:TRINITY_DN1716_c0_g2_i2.p2 TRINITY_DN1716_c0_g2~~TRINITY_DN1716_c0_g2_i2.p2  ORF type:complete len:158 (+),score=42.33 TRINITY_DN1716_c0_g2_i2:78-551(+)
MSQQKGIAATVKDVPAIDFIRAYAKHLKRQGKLELPKNVEIIKTACFKELGPQDESWFFIRAASIARQVYIRPGIGMGHLKRHYGGSVNRGYRPSHHGDAATGNIRKALQGLSDLGIVVDGDKGGRYISEKGRTDLDRVAAQVALARQQAQINPLDI